MSIIKNYRSTVFLITFTFLILIVAGCSRGLRKSIIFDSANLERYKLSSSKAPELKWEMKLPSSPGGLALISKKNVLISSNRGELYIVDILTGKRATRIWKPFNKPIDILFLGSDEGMIYFTSLINKGVYVYSLEKAKIREKFSLSGLQGQMVIISDTAFVLQGKKNILSFNKNTGESIRKVEINTSISKGIYEYGNLLWIIREDGCLLSYDIHLKPKDFLNLRLSPEPVATKIGDKIIACDSDGHVILIDLKKRKILFEKQLSAPIFSDPFVSDTVIVVGLADGKIVALNSINGAEIWCYQGEGLVNLPLMGTKSIVIVPFTRGRIVALDLYSGDKLWHYGFDRSLRLTKLTSEGIIVVDSKNEAYYLESKK